MDLDTLSTLVVFFEVNCGEPVNLGPPRRLRHSGSRQLALIYTYSMEIMPITQPV